MSSKIFDPQYWNLETVFKQVYSVPVYQRPYSWEKEQVKTLLEDLHESYVEDKTVGYYVGNIIVHDKNEKINGNILKFELIDGQQRITSFALILLASYCLSLKKGFPVTDPTVHNIRNSLWKFIDRKFVKEYHTVYLNSIEKKAFFDLYDYCFDADRENFDVISFCETYTKNNKFEERVFNNFYFIYNFLNDVVGQNTDEEILNFIDYILKSAQFIVIESTCKPNKVFSMFESINSKGKKLDDIDLIKTYIFSNLDPDDYDRYLNIWGNLIIETNDNLYDYLLNYIKAYISFYRQNISVINFKSLCKEELPKYYNEPNLSKALMRFLDDLNSKVKFYNMLCSTEKAFDLIKDHRFRFFYEVFVEIGYQHPKPLFLRTLIEYSENKFEKKEKAVGVFVETIKFMIKYLTLGGRDSKDSVTVFSNIMNDIYANDGVSLEIVNIAIVAEFLRMGIASDSLKDSLQRMDAFEQNKKVSIALLALYDSSIKDEKGNYKISFDQAYLILKNYSLAFSLDHLLVQSPEKNSQEFKYYKDETKNKLVLKEEHDFPQDIVLDGMDYDVFTKIILNKIGNLRIYYRDKNSGRQNTSISLAEYPNFVAHKNIVERGKNIADVIIDDILKMPKVDMTKVQFNSSKKSEDNLPKMQELIEIGCVKKGDKLYITRNPQDSIATLLNSKYVEFNGEKMTLNEWGCKVTGWRSIQIYKYVSIVGESETLHQKRLDYVKNNQP